MDHYPRIICLRPCRFLRIVVGPLLALSASIALPTNQCLGQERTLEEIAESQMDGLPPRAYEPKPQAAHRTSTVGWPNRLAFEHNLNNIRLTKTNQGRFNSAAFPSRTGETYLSTAGLWVGAVVGRDTLVSTGIDDAGLGEFMPGERDSIARRSINPHSEYYKPVALSEQDYIATYYDTLVSDRFIGQDQIDNRQHIPLYLEVVETSMQWSYDYASDFVLFDYKITNIGKNELRDAYVGIYYDGDTYFLTSDLDPAVQVQNPVVSGTNNDDIAGYLETFPAECGFVDTLNTAYIMDNDGDPNPPNSWSTLYSLRSVAGIRVFRTPDIDDFQQFNWWISGPTWYDFGPRRAPANDEKIRDMNGYLGTPYGDRNKYYVMSNREMDYDQLEMAVDKRGQGWLPPVSLANRQAAGGNAKFLMSYGPFTIFPGQTVPFTFAFVAGKFAHRDARDFQDLFDPYEPEIYKSTFNFSDFALNARWASWVYDNPGIDTDDDGYYGKSRDCVVEVYPVVDTIIVIDSLVNPPETTYQYDTSYLPSRTITQFYEGDGAPDFRGASPPPAPKLEVYPEVGKLTVRWNGRASETTPDPFTGEIDFEGYRVYMSFSNDPNDFVLQTSFDHENFNRYEYDDGLEEFVLIENPFTLSQLKQLYGQTFDPMNYGIDNPFTFFDKNGIRRLYYFTTTDWNRDQLNAPGTIQKVYPNAPKPPSDTTKWTDEHLTEDGQLKYYEYEYTFEDLLPSVPVFVSVTAFDFGSPRVNLPTLETVPTLNSIREYPLTTSQDAQDQDLPVVVYPNPYRSDGAYRESGYEARGDADLPQERARRIHFVNLPLVCTISIYSLDGDLVRQVIHDRPGGGPESMHAEWDLLSRNLQPVVSGIYYWVMETPDGSVETGKLVIIM